MPEISPQSGVEVLFCDPPDVSGVCSGGSRSGGNETQRRPVSAPPLVPRGVRERAARCFRCYIADTAPTTSLGVCSFRRPATVRGQRFERLSCPLISRQFARLAEGLPFAAPSSRYRLARGPASSRSTYSGWRCRTKPPTAVSLFCRQVQLARESKKLARLSKNAFCAKAKISRSI
jgi:hypothetical protein